MIDFDEVRAYLQTLKEGDRVIETGECCMKGREGDVYLNKSGLPCVKWEPAPGETGRMSTSATWGTRRIQDVKEQ